jgi:hypothetical protein
MLCKLYIVYVYNVVLLYIRRSNTASENENRKKLMNTGIVAAVGIR